MGGSQGWGSTVGQRNGRRPAASFGGGDVVEEDEEGQGGRRLGFPHVTRERMAQGTSLFLAFPCFCHVASKLGKKASCRTFSPSYTYKVQYLHTLGKEILDRLTSRSHAWKLLE
jgi:hypothetical protein